MPDRKGNGCYGDSNDEHEGSDMPESDKGENTHIHQNKSENQSFPATPVESHFNADLMRRLLTKTENSWGGRRK